MSSYATGYREMMSCICGEAVQSRPWIIC